MAAGQNQTGFSPAQIPGMIEPIEQVMLDRWAKTLEFGSQDCAVEFGSFLGRSTYCIAQGMESNPSCGQGNILYAYDSFACVANGGFYPHLMAFVGNSGLSQLLITEGHRISWLPVFKYHLGRYMESGTVVPVESELSQSRPSMSRIAMMHIDSPKFYSEFRYVLFRFFPLLRVGGIIVFQDMFYHWSATLIAAVAVLIEKGYLEMLETAATSLVCRVCKPFSLQEILDIDLNLEETSQIPGLIDQSIQLTDNIEMDRREIFQPRLLLAKIQWLFESGKHHLATEALITFFNQGGQLNNGLANDYLELMRHGFSIRKLYEMDHH